MARRSWLVLAGEDRLEVGKGGFLGIPAGYRTATAVLMLTEVA